MIDHISHLNSILVSLLLIPDHSWIVDQYIKIVELIFYWLGKFLNWLLFGKIKKEIFDASTWLRSWLNYVFYSFNIFLFISTTNNNSMSISIESSSRLEPNSWVTTCDNYILRHIYSISLKIMKSKNMKQLISYFKVNSIDLFSSFPQLLTLLSVFRFVCRLLNRSISVEISSTL